MRTLVLALTASTFALPARGGVLVVASDGSGQFTDLQPAVDAAQPGDVLLVKTGSYSAFSVTRSLAVVADTGDGIHVSGTARVSQIAAGSHVLLHRLRLHGAPGATPDDGPGLVVRDAPGSVRVQGCLLEGHAGLAGADVWLPSAVGFVDARLDGGVAPTQSGHGLRVLGGSVALYGSEVRGAAGLDGANGVNPPACRGGNGGHGVLETGSAFAFAGASLIDGGNGGAGGDGCPPGGSFGNCCYGGNAGSGVRLEIGAQVLWRLESAIEASPGGAGGSGQCGCGLVVNCDCDAGANAPALSTTTGDVVVALAGACPTLEVGVNPVREGGTVAIRVHTEPGNRVGLVVSTEPAFAPQAGRGVRLVEVAPLHPALRLGTAGASGLVEDTWTIPDLGTGVQARIVHLQAQVVRPDGSRAWSNAVELVMLDQAF